MKRSICVFILFCIAQKGFSQNHEIDSLKAIVNSGKADTIKLQALTDLNWLFLTTDVIKAKSYAFNELALAKKSNHTRFIAQGYNDIGLAYYRLGLLDSALNVFNQSLSIRKKLNDKKLIASSLSKISLIYNERGNYNNALKTQFETLKMYEELDNSNNQGIILNSIANTYEQLKNPNKAIEYNKKALAIHLKNNNVYQVGVTYNNMGNAYYSILNFKQAEDCYNKALGYTKKMNDKQFEAALYNGFAKLYRASKRNTEALNYYKKAYNISITENNKIDIELYRKNICSVLIDLKKYKEAEVLAIQNLKETDRRSKSQLKLIYRQMATIYGLTNRGDSAKLYLDKFSSITDSIYSETSAIEIANAEKRYESEKKENENKLLQQQNNIKTLENEKNKQTIFILIACISIATIIVLWQISLARIKKQKRALEIEKKLQQDRERISRDLHDNVGGQLSYVMFSLEGNEENTSDKRKEKAHNLANALRSVTGNLRETIWALNQEKLTVQDISDKLKTYTRNIFAYSDTKIKFEDHIENDETLNPAFALNLFRICQEVINNVFKHAKASELIITIAKDKKTTIVITDNGIGFSKELASVESFGLTNLKVRADEINATLIINSETDKGTKITLVV
jgi:signal transduction histidine kinase